jgi:hypothetical protein
MRILASLSTALLASFFAATLSAAVDGTVINLTTQKPQAGVVVRLIQPGAGGMKEVGTATSSADGRFRIEQDPAEGPALLQGLFQGVPYILILGPGQPRTGTTLNVNSVSKRQEIVKVTQHMVVLEPSAEKLQVSETYLLSNTSNETLLDPLAGSLRIVLPEGASQARVMVQSAMVPVERPAQETRQKGVFKVDYPIKPGETRFDVTYSLPPSTKFSGRTVYKEAPSRLVTPSAVTLTGEGLTSLGQEPTTQANIYDAKTNEYSVVIAGLGTLRPPTAPETGDDSAASGGPEIKQIKPKLYERLYWVLGLTLAILGLGFLWIYRLDSVSETPKS